MTWGPMVKTPRKISHAEALELEERKRHLRKVSRIKRLAWIAGLVILLNECAQVGERLAPTPAASIPAKNRQSD